MTYLTKAPLHLCWLFASIWSIFAELPFDLLTNIFPSFRRFHYVLLKYIVRQFQEPSSYYYQWPFIFYGNELFLILKYKHSPNWNHSMLSVKFIRIIAARMFYSCCLFHLSSKNSDSRQVVVIRSVEKCAYSSWAFASIEFVKTFSSPFHGNWLTRDCCLFAS